MTEQPVTSRRPHGLSMPCAATATRTPGHVMRSAIAAITYPRTGTAGGLEEVIGPWTPRDYATYISATQIILEAFVAQFGHEPIWTVLGALLDRADDC
jgi:hypothetical protein